jgi:hypothetical protein
MLNKIRVGADHFIVRIFLIFMVVAFTFWGIKDVLQGRNNFDLVTFSDAENITDDDFLKAKAEEINMIQRQTQTNLTQEEINQLGIDRIVLGRLINNSILKNIAKKYGLEITDETVINFVQNSPVFKNEKGEFDVNIFKSTFRNNYTSEEEYLSNIKNSMIKNNLLSIFLEGYKVPNVLVQSMINHMAETRTVDIIEMDLRTKSLTNAQPPSENELEEFYKNNIALFTLPEKRDIDYIKIPASFLINKVEIKEEELKEFFENNKDSLGLKIFDKEKAQIKQLVTEQKLTELMLELGKNLEDAVAAGSSLKEIAEKYDLKIISAGGLTKEIIENNELFKEIADIIFDLSEGELSYPIELKSSQELLLVELRAAHPSKVEDFADIKKKVEQSWLEDALKKGNIKILEALAKEYSSSTTSLPKGAKSKTITLTRAELQDNQTIPVQLLFAIFQIQTNKSTPIITIEDKGYFANLKQIKLDKKQADKIRKENGDRIASTIKNGAIDELISYFIKQNNMKVNDKDRVLQGE